MATQRSKGKCFLCGATFAKSAMTRHLKSCRTKTPERGDAGEKSRAAGMFQIMVEGRYEPWYWMYLDVRADAMLQDLDSFLRDIWLECCGHLSNFKIDGEDYMSPHYTDMEDENFMDEFALSDVLAPGMKFAHTYDFGTSTELALRVVSESESPATKEAVILLARNHPPEIVCGTCGKPATRVCPLCIYEGAEAWCCDECTRKHPCADEIMLLPVVNSPRVGMCAYSGPQEDSSREDYDDEGGDEYDD